MNKLYEYAARLLAAALIVSGGYAAFPATSENFSTLTGAVLCIGVSGFTFLAWEASAKLKGLARLNWTIVAILAVTVTVIGGYQSSMSDEVAAQESQSSEQLEASKKQDDDARKALLSEMESLEAQQAENTATKNLTNGRKQPELLVSLMAESKDIRERVKEVSAELKALSSVNDAGRKSAVPQGESVAINYPVLVQMIAFELFAAAFVFLAELFRSRQLQENNRSEPENTQEIERKQEEVIEEPEFSPFPADYLLDNRLVPENDKGEVIVAAIVKMTGLSRRKAKKEIDSAVLRGSLVDKGGRGNGRIYGYPELVTVENNQDQQNHATNVVSIAGRAS